MRIAFIQTGGTIDKDYPKRTGGYAFEISEPSVERILKRINPGFNYEIITAFRKDSLEITNDDRQDLRKICESISNDKIIITHGTDTMIETAKYLDGIKDKTIILTGAFLPEKFRDSDAEFNIGVAIGAINFLDFGVFIAMNGCVFPSSNVDRNRDSGVFLIKK